MGMNQTPASDDRSCLQNNGTASIRTGHGH